MVIRYSSEEDSPSNFNSYWFRSTCDEWSQVVFVEGLWTIVFLDLMFYYLIYGWNVNLDVGSNGCIWVYVFENMFPISIWILQCVSVCSSCRFSEVLCSPNFSCLDLTLVYVSSFQISVGCPVGCSIVSDYFVNYVWCRIRWYWKDLVRIDTICDVPPLVN